MALLRGYVHLKLWKDNIKALKLNRRFLLLIQFGNVEMHSIQQIRVNRFNHVPILFAVIGPY